MVISHPALLLDTSVLIASERSGEHPDALLDQLEKHFGGGPYGISFATIAELADGVYRSPDEAVQAKRMRLLQSWQRLLPVYPADAITGLRIGQLRAEAARSGIALPFADLIIGATALTFGCGVLTINLRDFRAVPRLLVYTLPEVGA